MRLIIKNKNELAITQHRKSAIEIIENGITAVLPENVMKAKVKFNQDSETLKVNNETFKLKSKRLFIIGGGKAAGRMALAMEDIITLEKIYAGIVICNKSNYNTKKIKILEASHPIPDERGVNCVKQLLALKNEYSMDENDFVLCLLSGGGSALLSFPVDEITLGDKQTITRQLLQSGANINEINIIRSHISKVKGGGLARYFAPTKIISLIISDVVGNDLTAIASGPTANNPATYTDAYNIIKKYNLHLTTPANILKYLKNRMQVNDHELSSELNNVQNFIIADNKTALLAMTNYAQKLGFKPKIITTELAGEPKTIAFDFANKIRIGEFGDNTFLLFGGETTPVIPKSHGKGGRNQHFAANSLIALKDYPGRWLVASMATDGHDFLTGVAGAIVDNTSIKTALARNINIQAYLDNFDSYNLLKKIGNSIIKSDNTGTNVGDVVTCILT